MLVMFGKMHGGEKMSRTTTCGRMKNPSMLTFFLIWYAALIQVCLPCHYCVCALSGIKCAAWTHISVQKSKYAHLHWADSFQTSPGAVCKVESVDWICASLSWDERVPVQTEAWNILSSSIHWLDLLHWLVQCLLLAVKFTWMPRHLRFFTRCVIAWLFMPFCAAGANIPSYIWCKGCEGQFRF